MANDKDEYGWDDDLDSLPDDALAQIESQAYLSTQQHRDQSRAPPSASAQAPPPGDPPPSDYALDRDEIQLNGETVAPGPPKNLAAAPPPRFGGNPPVPVRNRTSTRRTLQDLAANQSEDLYSHRVARHGNNTNYNLGRPAAAAPSQPAASLAGATEDELRRKIQELEDANAALTRAKSRAEAEAQLKAGEVTIVRGNLDRATKEHVTHLARLLQEHAEAIQKLRDELHAMRRDRDEKDSLNKFLDHELKVEGGKPKQPRRILKDGTARGQAASTPKKNRTVPFGDGFDDGDVVMVSPSKSRDKSRTGTPRQGSKRKRNAVEASPSKPLPILEAQAADDELAAPPYMESENDIFADTGKDDGKFKLLKRLMNHQPAGMRKRTFDAFAHYHFPSWPERPLSSIIYGGISLYRDESNDFTTHFCRILLSLWDRCAQEKYYLPLHLIIDTLQFILAFGTLEKTAALADEIVPLAQSSSLLVAWTSFDNPDLERYIDLQECLSILLTVARSCAHDEETITRFWTLISRDFLRAILKSPMLSTLTLTLQLLATSVTSTSFGPIPDFSPTDPPPDLNQLLPNDPITLVDHLTLFLHDLPSSTPAGPALPPPPRSSLWSFRLDVLQTISSFLPSPAAAAALAKHRYFLGRLLHLINYALSSLYSTAPRTPLATVLSRIVNLATRIAYTLMMDETTKPLIDRKEKLDAVQGASHAHLVALTRLAFVDLEDGVVESEELVGVGYASFYAPQGFGSGARILEAGIEEEVVDMAHGLLDEFLSPQEGEELLKVFSTARTSA